MGRRVSAIKELSEQTRLRTQFERRLVGQLQDAFEIMGSQTARDFERGSRSADRGDVEASIRRVMFPHYAAVIRTFSGRFQTVERKEDEFGSLYRAFITAQGSKRIKDISNTQVNKLNRIIEMGLDKGQGEAEIARNIRDKMGPGFTLKRAGVIARTETHNAASYANHEQAKLMEVPLTKRWVSTNDGRTRSHHSSLNGTEVEMEDDFVTVIKGIKYPMSYPGDPRGGAANVINCRCVVLYVEAEDAVVDSTPEQDPVKVPVPVEDYGDTGADELLFHKQGGWDNETVIASVIRKTPKVPEIWYGVSRAYCSGSATGIGMSTRKGFSELSVDDKNTWRHEYGHHVDRIIMRDKLGQGLRSLKWAEKHAPAKYGEGMNPRYISGALYKEILEDRKKWKPSESKLAKQRYENWYRRKSIDEALAEARARNRDYLTEEAMEVIWNRSTFPLDFDEMKKLGFEFSRLKDPEDFGELIGMINAGFAGGNTFGNIGYLNRLYFRAGRVDAFGNFTDYLEAMSNASIGFGHGKGYYEKFEVVVPGVRVGHSTEMMANYTSLLGGENKELWRRLLEFHAPKSTKGFDSLFAAIEKEL